ncbi:MAG TPA: peptidoglycan-associated lipoprotein Pal [Candidatus Eisenbacteria bacterium]|uniref:Peptidoglycan-associated lipoprotein n=1 Tax=Eiseniibacteriota bacterium TaxID=2212470 RepID=A0A7V2F3S4_UNCEI|nr:peptidoglycan-associated lipoprotein Pal [Candidatus Eisenbacteria bacterium]
MARNLLFVMLLSIAMIVTACAKKEAVPVIEEVEPVEEVAPPLEEIEEDVEPVVEEAEPLVLEDVFFDFDKFNIKKEYEPVLIKNAEMLLSRPGAKLLIEGHCDERGTNEYNIALGEKRAKSVLDFYVTYGIDEGRLSMVSYGEERPFARGNNEEAWAKNRRAHMVVQ